MPVSFLTVGPAYPECLYSKRHGWVVDATTRVDGRDYHTSNNFPTKAEAIAFAEKFGVPKIFS